MFPGHRNTFLFGTVGAPRSTPKKPGGSVGAINRLRELNLDALELGWVRSVRVSQETCQAIKASALTAQMALSVHAPYFINLNADESEWPRARQRLMDAAFYGSLAGATDIVFHPGSYFGRSPRTALNIAIPRLQACAHELQEQGINVILRPETMGKSAMLGSLLDTLILSQETPHVLPCLDFAHLHARPGDGSMNTTAEWLDVLDQYQEFLGAASLKNLHIHLSGIDYTKKGEKKHLAFHESDMDVQALFAALIKKGCAGRILCESPLMEEDALFLRELWNIAIGEAPPPNL